MSQETGFRDTSFHAPAGAVRPGAIVVPQRAIPAGVPSQLLERRPDLRQAEQALIAANAQTGAARALCFPTISLTGAFGTSSNDLSKLFSGPSRAWSYAGQLVGPIFTFGAISGQVAQAEAARDAALLRPRTSTRRWAAAGSTSPTP